MRLAPLIIALVLLSAVCAEATAPQIYPPTLAVFHDQDTSADNPNNDILVSISGANFGTPEFGNFSKDSCGQNAGGAFVLIRQNNAVQFTAGSTNTTRVYSWTPTQVVVKIGTGVANKDNLNVEVCTKNGATGRATLVKYEYEHVNVEPVNSLGSFPLALTRTPNGTLWINEESHTKLKSRTIDGTPSFPNIPQASGSGIFATPAFLDPEFYPPGPTRTTLTGEDITVDGSGRVWFTEGGAFPHGPQCIGGSNVGAGCWVSSQCPDGSCTLVSNWSRIVMYDPLANLFKAYNIPGENPQVIGLAWDADRGRIWFTEAVRSQLPGTQAQGARLTSFDPDNITPNNTFAFTTTETCSIPFGDVVGKCSTTTTRDCYTNGDCVLANEVCPPDATSDANCYREYSIPSTNGAVGYPAHVLVHSDGSIWYSAYWGGNHIGRLDPATGAFQQFPLPRPIDEANCSGTSCATCDPTGVRCFLCCNSYPFLGSGPWSLVEASNGDIVLSYQNQPAVGRFSYAAWQSHQCNSVHATDCACLSLNGSAQNPCLTNTFNATFDAEVEYPHSVALDGSGQAWLTHSQNNDATDCDASTSIALLPVGVSHMVLFPPLGFYTSVSAGCTAPSTTGMVFDPTTGAMWFNEFRRKRLSRMTPVS